MIGALLGLGQFLTIESSLKMMESAFYFTSKALFVIKILKFLSWRFGYVAKRLDKKKIRLISSFETSQPVNKQMHYTHIAQYREQ